ncbi:MAG TPA: U32 family peptidase [Thermoanaerobacterium sp.]|nr:U32 family peptidase [Thermoanaerobacterium sp.]
MKRVELLAPAGNLETLKFALNYGADAVYIGGKLFGARAYAANFEENELKEAVEYAHLRDRKVYVTVNTIVFNKEVDLLLKYIDYLYQLNVDAIIVQDFGVVKLLKDFYPELDIHASTQMTLSNLESIKAAKEIGIKRVVMPRELSLKEIEKIKSVTGIEVEVFVHGALCVSYSGQCLFSSIIGGRSGNRGRCAGPCRLKYDLLDDKMNTIASNMHLLSMADLCTIDHIKDMIESGIDSFKIEGRMKEKEYVASVVASYRKAIDAYLSGEKINTGVYKEMMSGIFTRGFSNGYLYEKKPDYMSYVNPKNKGVPLGKVISIDGKKIKVSLSNSLSVGDGISTETGEHGYKVDVLIVDGKKVDEAHKGQVVELKKIPVNYGDVLYKTYDVKLNKLFSVSNELKSPVDVFVNMKENRHLNIMIKNNDICVSKDSKIVSTKALKKAVDKDTLIEKVSSINDTPFYVNDIEVNMDEGLFMPLSEVKETRRKAVEDLIAKKLKYRSPKNIDINLNKLINDKISDLKLSFYTEKEEHVKIACALGADRVYFNYRLNGDVLKNIICYMDKCEIIPAFPQIMRDELDDFQREIKNIKEMGFKKVLVTNLGMYDAAVKLGFDVCIDFNLNVSNSLAVDFFDKADTITLSPELNIHQIEDISLRSNAKFEAIAYGRLPLLTMEYCPIKNLKGCDKKGCQEGKYFLKDRKGNLMKIVSDGFCRIKLLNSSVLYMVDKINDLKKTGLSYIRINDTVESDEEVRDVIKAYKDSLEFGTYDLHVENYTRGHFYRGVL